MENALVMIVEDNDVVRACEEVYLKSLGYKTEAHANPLQALDAVRKDSTKYGIVLTDLQMPELNGLDLSDRIREVDPSLPIIMLTANLLKRATPIPKNIRKIIQKPPIPEEVGKAIEEYIRG